MIEFDCHAHVYEETTAVAGSRYRPKSPAPLSDWLGHLDARGLKGGVIVQVSFLGTDNSQLCAALAKLNRNHFCGVAVVPLDVDDQTLDDLVKAGIRGVRWNLVSDAKIPDLKASATQAFFEKLRDRNLHLEVHLEGPRLARLVGPLSTQGILLVVDHFGLPSEQTPDADPMIDAVEALADKSSLYFKFSGHYRSPFDLTQHAQALLELLPPDHIVWGSDWPHTQHEDSTSYEQAYRATGTWREHNDAIATSILYGVAAT